MLVPISSIIIPTNPPRIRINPGSLTGLAENLKRYGMLHPIVVREEGTKYEGQETEIKSQIPNLPAEALAQASPKSEMVYRLIAGYRRLKAAESIGWTEVPVTIQVSSSKYQVPNLGNESQSDSSSAISALSEFDQQVSENVHRLNLSPLELSDAIFERKHRFEQIYGPIHRGGDQTKNDPEQSKLQTLQFAPPSFYEQTGRLFRMSESAIYQLLRLQGIEPDLKLKVETRELNYAAALSEQAKRNQERKSAKKPNSNSGKRIPGIPDPKTAQVYLEMYRKSPKLFQIFQLVNHSVQLIQRLAEYQNEYSHIDLELLHNFIIKLKQLVSIYGSLVTDLEKTLDQHLNSMLDTNPPQADSIS